MRPGRAGVAALLATLALSVGYLVPFVDRGWVPADEGTISQTAERVLGGEIPHRDYDESYTGGLTYLHALAFRLFGVRFLSLRFVLLAFAVLFVAVFFSIARRFAPAPAAGLVTLVAVVWSFPNYFASLPSWYVLVFATCGTLALLRHVETGAGVWLFVAGFCGGMAIVFIVVGVYYVAAGVLFLVYREQTIGEAGAGAAEVSRPGSLRAFTGTLCLLFLAALGWLLRRRFGAAQAIQFLLPPASLCVLLYWNEGRAGRGAPGERLRRLAGLWTPFALGTATPIVLFAAPFAASHALGDLWRGVLVAPQRRLDGAFLRPPGSEALAAALPYALLLLRPGWLSDRRRRRLATAAVVAGLAAVWLLSAGDGVYRAVWLSARSLAVVASVVGCIALAGGAGVRSLGASERQRLFLLVAVAALVSLVQFPFAAPIYFCYVAPLVVLAVLAVVRSQPGAPVGMHLAAAAFYLLFAAARMNTGYIWQLGRREEPYRAQARLDLPRAGLRVPEADASSYRELVRLLGEKSRGGVTFASPDAPEVYFLSGLRNPTRILYDFLSDPPAPPGRLGKFLEAKGVTAVAINRSPDFSAPLSVETSRALEEAFPMSREVGRFLVRWKE